MKKKYKITTKIKKGGAVMNSQEELLQFKKKNIAYVNRIVFLVLVVIHFRLYR